jgi:hypothetical protein
MGWERIKSGDGIYEVNWDGVRMILRPWARAMSMARNARWTASEKHWIGPDIYTVEVDWQKVRHETDTRSEAELRSYGSRCGTAVLPLLRDLDQKIEQTQRARNEVMSLMQSAQRTTMQNIADSIDRAEVGLKTLTVIRNLSATTLLIGATVLSGGGAAAAAPAFAVGATGNALTRVGTWEDSGFSHSGRAAAAFATDLVIMMVPVAGTRALKNVTDTGTKLFAQLCLVKGESVLKGLQSGLVEGGHAQDALLKGVIHFTGGTHEEIAKSVLESNPKLERWIVPMKVGFQLLEMGAEKVVEHLGEKSEAKSDAKLTTNAHRLMDAAIIHPRLIEGTAIRRARN